MPERLRDMPGLGPKSEASLQEVGINTPGALRDIGAVDAFILLRKNATVRPSLNFLYALVGALENRHWAAIAREERDRLLFDLEGREKLEELLYQASMSPK